MSYTWQQAFVEVEHVVRGYLEQSEDIDDKNSVAIYQALLDVFQSAAEKVTEGGVTIPVGTFAESPLTRVEEPWQWATDVITGWAEAALPGAPYELVELVANICWSCLQGSNPDPLERIVHGESIKFLAGALENAAPENETELGVSSGSIDVVL